MEDNSRRAVSDIELLGLRIDNNGSALWTIPSPEKRLSASMKNRTEDAKLRMYKSMLDKHAFRSRFEVDKVKKQAVTILQQIMETSGTSGEGVVPNVEDGELLDELAPFYKNGLHLSEKRLTKWRLAEDQMQHVIAAGKVHHLHCNNPLISEGRKQVDKYTVQKLLSHLTIDEGKDSKKQRSQTEIKSRQELPRGIRRPPDVFASIKPNSDNQEKTFSVTEWQSVITKNYIASVHMENSDGKEKIEGNMIGGKLKSSSTRSMSIANPRKVSPTAASSRPKSAPGAMIKNRRLSVKLPTVHTSPRNKKVNDRNDRQEKPSERSCASSESNTEDMEIKGQSENKSEEKIEKQDTTTFISQLPHWKRDLLKEAPRALFSKRDEVKVNIVMSKAKRAQELDRLVTQHVYDPKLIAKRERERREFNRLHLRTTLTLLQENSVSNNTICSSRIFRR